MTLIHEVNTATSFVRERYPQSPRVGIVLGSGLGRFAYEIDSEAVVDYCDIPHFARSTAIGHAGKLVCGRIGQVNVCVMIGRFHCYEGYSLAQVAFPIRMMHELGVEVLIVSNACGGLNPNYAAGDIMVVAEQLNLMFRNPLISDSSECCPRGLPFRPTYDVELITTAQEVARQRGILIHKGVYAAVAGPNYETRAEIRMLRQLGADVVGMSTVPEVIVARQLGLRVLGLSAVTNKCSADLRVETSGDHVIVAAESTQPKLRDIVLGVINRL